jgi:CDGSH-type Zn-finger protein
MIEEEGSTGHLEGVSVLEEARIKVRLNGPYRVQGPVIVEDVDGNRFELPGEVFALCRCGGSSNKPFCDGTHRKIGFDAETRAK